MATSRSTSLNALHLSPPRGPTSRPTPDLSRSEPRKKILHSRSTSMSDGETCARPQSMYSMPPGKQPDVFYTIPLTPLPYSPQPTFPGTPQNTPRPSVPNQMDAIKQSPQYKPLTPLQASPQQTFPGTPQTTPRPPAFSPSSSTKQPSPYKPPTSPAGASEQTQHTSIKDTPKLKLIGMKTRKLPLSKQTVSEEAYTPTQSVRTLPTVNTKSESSYLEPRAVGAQRSASAISPDTHYRNTQPPSSGSSSMGSDRVFLDDSGLDTKPFTPDRDSVQYESGSVYYNQRAGLDHTYQNLPGPKASFFTEPTETFLTPAYPQAPPLPRRPHKKPPPPVEPKPDYLHSRNPFAKPGPPDPFMGSGAVVGLTKKTFKKFIRDLDAAFVMFYNPCDKKCCGARATMRQVRP